ncbi:MAG: serine hydrolase [Saprospiraceae bacterium]|nr:serine hydrolase [Saprospiraceae bacterium]
MDDKFYFYPASTIKMPVAAMALQKVRQLAREKNIGINKYTPLSFRASRPPQTAYKTDSLSDQPSTIDLFVDEIFSISDNNASNRLFEFVGPEYLNEQLYQKGAFTTSHIIHRVGVGGFTPEDNQQLNEMQFLDTKENPLLSLAARQEKFARRVTLSDQSKGKGYLDANDSLVRMPFDFSQKNFISINDLEGVLKRIVFS